MRPKSQKNLDYWTNLANQSADVIFLNILLKDIAESDDQFALSLSHSLTDPDFKKVILKQINRIKYDLQSSNHENGLIVGKTIIRILDAREKTTWLKRLERWTAEEILDTIEKNLLFSPLEDFLINPEFRHFIIIQIGKTNEKTPIRKILSKGKIGLEEAIHEIKKLNILWNTAKNKDWKEMAKNSTDETFLKEIEDIGISSQGSPFKRSLLAHIGLPGNKTCMRTTLLQDPSIFGLLELKKQIEVLELRLAKMMKNGQEKKIVMEIIQQRIKNTQDLKGENSISPLALSSPQILGDFI